MRKYTYNQENDWITTNGLTIATIKGACSELNAQAERIAELENIIEINAQSFAELLKASESKSVVLKSLNDKLTNANGRNAALEKALTEIKRISENKGGVDEYKLKGINGVAAAALSKQHDAKPQGQFFCSYSEECVNRVARKGDVCAEHAYDQRLRNQR